MTRDELRAAQKRWIELGTTYYGNPERVGAAETLADESSALLDELVARDAEIYALKDALVNAETAADSAKASVRELEAELAHANANLATMRMAGEKFMQDAEDAEARAETWKKIANAATACSSDTGEQAHRFVVSTIERAAARLKDPTEK